MSRSFSIIVALIFSLVLVNIASCQSACWAAHKKAPKKTVTTHADNTPVSVNFRAIPILVHPVRIGLSCRVRIAHVAVWAPGAVFVDDRPVFALKPEAIYDIYGGRIIEEATGRSYVLPRDCRPIISAFDPSRGCYQIWTNNRWYRGVLELINYGSVCTVIDILDIEDYLKGVVPSEMPANWHMEALKSQAVAARSYAWAHLGSGSKWMRSEGFDIVPDVRDQAYKGLAAENIRSSTAVAQTLGFVLKDSGRVKPGFYRATVGDSDQENLNLRTTSVPTEVLERVTHVKNIVGVTVKKWDANGNATVLQILGRSKAAEVNGVVLARMLGFTTAGVLDAQPEGSTWLFTYRGPGNGSRGLSQHGAQQFATRGWNYQSILQQYYQDTDGQLRLDTINPGRYLPAVYMGPIGSSQKYGTTNAVSAQQVSPLKVRNGQTKSVSGSSQPGQQNQIKQTQVQLRAQNKVSTESLKNQKPAFVLEMDSNKNSSVSKTSGSSADKAADNGADQAESVELELAGKTQNNKLLEHQSKKIDTNDKDSGSKPAPLGQDEIAPANTVESHK